MFVEKLPPHWLSRRYCRRTNPAFGGSAGVASANNRLLVGQPLRPRDIGEGTWADQEPGFEANRDPGIDASAGPSLTGAPR